MDLRKGPRTGDLVTKALLLTSKRERGAAGSCGVEQIAKVGRDEPVAAKELPETPLHFGCVVAAQFLFEAGRAWRPVCRLQWRCTSRLVAGGWAQGCPPWRASGAPQRVYSRQEFAPGIECVASGCSAGV